MGWLFINHNTTKMIESNKFEKVDAIATPDIAFSFLLLKSKLKTNPRKGIQMKNCKMFAISYCLISNE
jgi:hypothetical protein